MAETRFTVTFTIEALRDDPLATWRVADRLAVHKVNRLLGGSGLVAVGVTVAPAIQPVAVEDVVKPAVPPEAVPLFESITD